MTFARGDISAVYPHPFRVLPADPDETSVPAALRILRASLSARLRSDVAGVMGQRLDRFDDALSKLRGSSSAMPPEATKTVTTSAP